MRSAILTLVLALLVASPAAAQQDLRTPDTRDAATRLGAPRIPTSDTLELPRIRQDLRSPDSRDAAAGRDTSDAPEVTVVKLPQPARASAGGIDWGDAGIGAAFTLVLSAAGIVAVMVPALSRRDHSVTVMRRVPYVIAISLCAAVLPAAAANAARVGSPAPRITSGI